MGKLVMVEFLTLDGVMQAASDPNEDRSGGFEHGGWQPRYVDEVFGGAVMGSLNAAGAFLLGRKTYEIFAAHWPNQPADDPLAGAFNGLPKYVVSTTLQEPLAWQNSTLIADDVPSKVAHLKQGADKEIHLIGSGELAQTVMANHLVDEYRLMIHPLVLGTGKRLFRDGTSIERLQLVDSRATTTGVIIATYVSEAAEA